MTGERLRILHLGFEDHRRPGSGGGSARNRAVNSRLGARHDITVVTAGFPGATDRVEDGVRYEHLGLERGYAPSLVSYLAMLPAYVARRAPAFDLVIEEFAAPISSVSVPRWTSRPTLAVVQWLNAEQKARQYHLPFGRLERAGVRAHRHFVAMSQDLAADLRALNPQADVRVIPNGVDAEALTARAPVGEDVVYLGRLEREQKGLDTLLDAYAQAAPRLPGRLVVAGDGPDRGAVLARARRLGVDHRVDLVGRLEGPAKLRLLAGARLVAVPSRFETFGMVALEAQACGSPVVAFDIDCLREVVRPPSGTLVALRTPEALAAALVDVHRRVAPGPARDHVSEAARAFAGGYDWDRIAEQQEQCYREVVDAAGGVGSRRAPVLSRPTPGA